MLVLGVDPGLGHMGIALMDVFGERSGIGVKLDSATVVETVPSPRKLGVRKGDDNMRRARLVSRELLAWARDVHLICYEAQSFGMGGKVASRQAGTAFGVIASVAETLAVPIVCVQPRDLKLAVAFPGASKSEVIERVRERFPGRWRELPARLHEHAADAIAAVVASLDDDTMRACLGRYTHPVVRPTTGSATELMRLAP